MSSIDIATFRERLHALRDRADDWDGRGSAKPNADAIQRAHDLADGALFSPRGDVRFPLPSVGSDEAGDVVLEWNWLPADRRLTVYVGVGVTTYLYATGPSFAEMTDGQIPEPRALAEMLRWMTVAPAPSGAP